MSVATIATATGTVIAIIGLLVKALKDAEARGRMKQVIEEQGNDINGFGERVGRVESRQNRQEADISRVQATLESLIAKHDSTDRKIDHLINIHLAERGEKP